MNFIEDLYTYDIEEKKVNKILNRISKGKKVKSLFVITYPLLGDGILEIYEYKQLLKPYYKKRTDDIRVVGMSHTKAGAEMIILNIVQQMCDASNYDFNNIKKFVE